MKPIRHLIILALALVTTLAGAQTSTPGEQFQSAVAAFQKSATEDNARKLAELLKQLDPPPAIPDDAKLHALKGAAFVKQTKSETDPAAYAALYAKAAAEYQAASAAAPWVGDYYFNRASCEKSAGQFAAATAALKLDLIFARTEQDRDANLALRAEIETTQEIAATRKLAAEKAKSEQAAKEAAATAAKQQATAAAEVRRKNSIEGAWFYPKGVNQNLWTGLPDFVVRRKGETLEFQSPIMENFASKNVRLTGTTLYVEFDCGNAGVEFFDLQREGENLVGKKGFLGRSDLILTVRCIRKPWKDVP